MSSLISYRKEIDGLRALAVISVVIFHLKNSLLPGGFVGVDIFFVISGFLITKIIIREVEANRFSFTNFYIRRIRRIFPALFLVLFVSLILAILILTTEDMIWFAKTLRYAAIQISNFLFQREVGYFDPAFEDMPLLHTWSLAVEEQFYLIWPVTLLLLFKFKKNHNLPFYGLIVISTISLIFSEYLVNHNQKVAFFSLPSRLWELGVGGILAFHKIKQPKKSLNEALGIIGLTIIIISLFVIEKDNFPGISALLPCLGTALIIFSGHRTETIVSRFLSNKLFIFFGLISYSLYLWHWPIIAFYKEYTGEANLSIIAILLIATISVAISYLSYRYVEIPFRRKRHLDEENSLTFSLGTRSKNNKEKPILIKLYDPIIVSIICVSLFIGVAINIKDKDGWEWRIHKATNKYPNLNKSEYNFDKNCHLAYKNFLDGIRFKDAKDCLINGKNKNFEAIIFGDSHSSHYGVSVSDWSKNKGLSASSMTMNRCLPMFGIQKVTKKGKPRDKCDYYPKAIKNILKKNKNIEYIFLAARWELYTQIEEDVMLIDNKSKELSKENTQRVFKENLDKTVKHLTKMGKKVIILGQVPRLDKTIGANKGPLKCIRKKATPLQKIIKIDDKKCVEADEKISTDRIEYAHQVIREVSLKYKNAEFFDPKPYFCDERLCYAERDGKVVYRDGKVVYRDDDHLNIYGGHYLGRKLMLK